MISTATSQGLGRDLANKLTLKLQNGSGLNTVRTSADANGWFEMFVSNASAGEGEGHACIYIRIRNPDMVSKDVFGNQTFAYSPSILDFAFEMTSTSGVQIPSLKDIFTCLYECQRTGVAITIKEIANGTAVTETSVNAATALETLDNLYWPNKGV